MSGRTRGIPHTAERAAFPLGGIGTGNVSIGARGELRDWELENLPDKGRFNPLLVLRDPRRPRGRRAGYARARGAAHRTPRLGCRIPVRAPGRSAARSTATLHGEYPVVDVDFDDAILPVERRHCAPSRRSCPSTPTRRASLPRCCATASQPGGRARARSRSSAASSHTAGRGDGPFGMRAAQTRALARRGRCAGARLRHRPARPMTSATARSASRRRMPRPRRSRSG